MERPYSIVSSPREPLLELFVELIPPPVGHLTPLLHALGVGATVTLRPRAKGVFLLRPEFRNHVMVATVTGIAPFVSMLRHWLESPAGEANMYVLEGASFLDEFGYDDELRAMAARHANIRFIPTCSRPDVGDVGRIRFLPGVNLTDGATFASPQFVEEAAVADRQPGYTLIDSFFLVLRIDAS